MASKYKPRVYLEVDGATAGDVLDWLCNAEFPWNVQDVKFPGGALNTLQETLEAQSSEIEVLIHRTDELTTEVDRQTERAEHAEHEVEELLSPSSRRPPPHFKLPDERPSLTHAFRIGPKSLGHGYITAGYYPGTNDVGEIFIKMAVISDAIVPGDDDDPQVAELRRQISDLTFFLKGILDQLAIAVSIGLQRGIPLEAYVTKFIHTRFPPDGITQNPAIRSCSSIIDYIFRWLSLKFLETKQE